MDSEQEQGKRQALQTAEHLVASQGYPHFCLFSWPGAVQEEACVWGTRLLGPRARSLLHAPKQKELGAERSPPPSMLMVVTGALASSHTCSQLEADLRCHFHCKYFSIFLFMSKYLFVRNRILFGGLSDSDSTINPRVSGIRCCVTNHSKRQGLGTAGCGPALVQLQSDGARGSHAGATRRLVSEMVVVPG